MNCTGLQRWEKIGSVANVRPVHAHEERRVADPGDRGVPAKGGRVPRHGGGGARAWTHGDPQAAEEERQRDRRHRVRALAHRRGVIFSSTVVPSRNGVVSVSATFTARIRVSVGRPGSCGFNARRVTESATSSIRPAQDWPG